MIGFTMVGSADLARSIKFYDAVLAPFGLVRVENDDSYVAYAPQTDRDAIEFYIAKPYNGEPASVGNGCMVAFKAESRSAVDEYHKVGLESGGVNEGLPGPRPADASNYYAYIRDLDGNKICSFA